MEYKLSSARSDSAVRSPAGTVGLLLAVLWGFGVVLVHGPTRTAKGADESQVVAFGQDDAKVPTVEEQKALAEFHKVYHLDDKDQVIKRIKPPLPIGRLYDLDKWFPELHVLQGGIYGESNLRYLIYRERGGKHENKAPSFHFSSPAPQGIEARELVQVMAKVEPRHVDDPQHLLNKLVEGDYVIHADAPVDKIVFGLEQIFRRECDLPVKLTLGEVEEDIVAVSGRIKPPFVPTPETIFELYAATLQPGKGQTEKGTFQEFLDDVGRFITPNRRVINELEHGVREKIRWHRNIRARFDDRTLQQDREPRSVLDHVEEQTGLSFALETRTYSRIVVERK
jgi:hypothetical protein